MTETTVVPLELRAATDGGHVLTGLCVPYNRVTHKTEHPRGERFMPGAFASVASAPTKVRLTDFHLAGQVKRPVAVATELRETGDGLLGSFRFYDTPEGRGAFENVLEQTYGGLSVGFVPMRERTGPDGVREVHEARLFHVSLVDEPAYEDARILAVRAAEEAAGTSARAEAERVAEAAQQQPSDLDELLARSWMPDAFTSRADVVTLGIEYGSR